MLYWYKSTKTDTEDAASTLARLFSNLPRVGKPIRVMTYDLHTLQNRFYLRYSICLRYWYNKSTNTDT